MTPGRVKIELFYDVISPYAWFAFESLLRYQRVWPIEVVLVPYSLKGIMKATGNQPPGFVPSKQTYAQKDIQRNNDYWNMNLVPPKDFIKWLKTESSDNAMRLLLVIEHERPEMLEKVSREFWKRIWTRGEPIFHRQDFEKVLSASGLPNAAHYIEKIDEEWVSIKLQENTSRALSSGAFGAPWIVVHKDGEQHAFFGSDRLPLIGHLIGQKFIDGLCKYAKL